MAFLALGVSLRVREKAGQLILVVDDVEEVRDCIERLLKTDGYRVETVKSEEHAVESARRRPPQLALMNLDGPADEVVGAARRLRERAPLDPAIPIVVFCCDSVAEGAEVDFGDNVYVTRPDNFNQLRVFMRRLLQGAPTQS